MKHAPLTTQLTIALACALLLVFADSPPALAQVYDGTSFVGLPVFAVDGTEVGEVVAEDYGPDGLPSSLRISVGQPLGLGEKTIEFPREHYVGLRGAVTLDASVDEIEGLPSADD